MAKPRTLANTVSNGGPLADGAIAVADVTGLQTALDAKEDSAALAAVATTGDFNDLTNKPTANSYLPSQTGNGGKYLTTDGTNASWASVSGTPDFVLMSQGVI